FLIKTLLIPGIQPPGELISESLKEVVLVQAYQANGEGFFSNCQLNLFVDNFLSRIKGTNEMLRPAFYFKGNDIIVRNHQRSYIKIMRSNGCDHKTRRLREYDWAVTT